MDSKNILAVIAVIIAVALGALLWFADGKNRVGDVSRTAFLACLDDPGTNEQDCIARLGRFAWYPQDEDVCTEVAGQIEAVFKAGGMPRWPALFRNERCARLGLPHNDKAAAPGDRNFADNSWPECYKIDYSLDRCDDLHGRHMLRYDRKESCRAMGEIAVKEPLWSNLFANERCWRLGMPHQEPE